MERDIVMYSLTGLLHSQESNEPDDNNDIDELHGHHAEQISQIQNEKLTYDSVYRTFKNR